MKELKSMRLHIGIFGKTNTGKSSLLNSILNQEISITSSIAGTTTDVVEKSAELFPIGPFTFLDTAGLDDFSELGDKRIEKTLKILNRTDVGIIVCDYNGFSDVELDLVEKFKTLNIPFAVVINKNDEKAILEDKFNIIKNYTDKIIQISVLKDEKVTDKFVELLLKILPEEFSNSQSMMGDLINADDVVVLVTPIDKEAPKGRLILPEVQAIRDSLDNSCIACVTQVPQLEKTLSILNAKPKLVVTDSQAFKEVNAIVPDDIYLTSFSILLARLKGDLATFVQSVKILDNIKDGDRILIAESCTHHRIDDDIAQVKIPRLIQMKTGVKPSFEYYSGHDFPMLDGYKLIIHCGACMTNKREVLSRILLAKNHGVPITNYGITISYCLGILDRAIAAFNLKY